jgi:hypothetical protein
MFRTPFPSAALLSLACVTATTAAAAVMSPGQNNITPPCISLVGTRGGVSHHAMVSFQVIVRDLADNPKLGSHVVVDLSGCPDLHLCADQLDPAVDIDCPNKRVGKFTDATGTARFTLLGGSNGSGHAVELTGGGKICENCTLIGVPTVSSDDLDGANGVGINDLPVWRADFGAPGSPSFGRSEYACGGNVGINDLAVRLTAFGSGAQVQSCGETSP